MKNNKQSTKLLNYSQSILGTETINSDNDCVKKGLIYSNQNFKFNSTLVKSKKTPKCYPTRPCKKMSCCGCIEKRRASFIRNGAKYLDSNNLTHFVTVAFSMDMARKGYEWDDLFKIHLSIWKIFYRHPAPKYVRCLALGNADEKKHIHIVLNEKMGRRFISNALKNQPDCSSDIKKIDDATGVLGYMYDQNFVPSYNHHLRPFRCRLLTASKGLRCGFPVDQQMPFWLRKNKKRFKVAVATG